MIPVFFMKIESSEWKYFGSYFSSEENDSLCSRQRLVFAEGITYSEKHIQKINFVLSCAIGAIIYANHLILVDEF